MNTYLVDVTEIVWTRPIPGFPVGVIVPGLRSENASTVHNSVADLLRVRYGVAPATFHCRILCRVQVSRETVGAVGAVGNAAKAAKPAGTRGLRRIHLPKPTRLTRPTFR